jgi:hypothetical protein
MHLWLQEQELRIDTQYAEYETYETFRPAHGECGRRWRWKKYQFQELHNQSVFVG